VFDVFDVVLDEMLVLIVHLCADGDPSTVTNKSDNTSSVVNLLNEFQTGWVASELVGTAESSWNHQHLHQQQHSQNLCVVLQDNNNVKSSNLDFFRVDFIEGSFSKCPVALFRKELL